MRLWISILALLMSASAGAAEPPRPSPSPDGATKGEPRKLTLAEAVSLAMRIDPMVNEAHITDQRQRLGVFRAQLDRFSFKVDGQLQELWNKTNLGGPTLFNCTTALGTGAATRSECLSAPGVVGTVADTAAWQGLSSLQAQLNYFLFSGFKVEANVKRAHLSEQAALVQIKQQRKDLALQVARAYWNVRRNLIQADVQRAALDRMIEAERIADARVRAGLAAPIDKNRATQRKLTQEATLQELLGEASVAQVQLAVTLGLQGEIVLVDDPPIPAAVPVSAEEMVRDAWRRRPETQNAHLQTEIQHQQVRIARSGFFPQVNLFGLFQYGNNPFNVGTGARNAGVLSNPFSNLTGALTLGATLNMNFFDTFNTYTQTADAHYQEKINQQEELRFQRLVDSDVRQAHANLLRLYARRAPLQAARDIARDNLTIQESRYKNGDALMTDYLDSQIDLSNAELNLADVSAQLQSQWLELQAALGFIVGTDNG
jgi:outer membrane protein TolC